MGYSVNKVTLLGNLGKDPELTDTPNGNKVCKFSMAMNEKWKDKDGNAHEKTEWANIVFWGKPAEILAQYAKKGSQLYVEGKYTTRKWEDKEGKDRYTTEVVGKEFCFIGSKGGGESTGSESSSGYSGSAPDDDIPF